MTYLCAVSVALVKRRAQGLLVHRQVLKGRGIIADRTYPLRTLFLKLEVGGRIKALNVTALQPSYRHNQTHVTERIFQRKNLGRGNDVRVAGLFGDCSRVSGAQSMTGVTELYNILS